MVRFLLAVFSLCAFAHAQAPPADAVYSYAPRIVKNPVPIHLQEAEMPDKARRLQLPGVCALELIVDKKGNPQDARVVRCSDPVFAQNSLNAVKGYRFQPATTVADNKPVLFRTHIDISYRFGSNPDQPQLPRPRIKLDFLIPSQPPSSTPDSSGAYTLSHAFDAPNSLPRLHRWVGVGFRRAAFSLNDGAGCTVDLAIDADGLTSDVQITKCDDPSLEEPVMRSLLRSRFSPAILNGKAVPVRASLQLACEGFEPTSGP